MHPRSSNRDNHVAAVVVLAIAVCFTSSETSPCAGGAPDELLETNEACGQVDGGEPTPSPFSPGEAEILREAAQAELARLARWLPEAEVAQAGMWDYFVDPRDLAGGRRGREPVWVDGRDLREPFFGTQEWAAHTGMLDNIGRLAWGSRGLEVTTATAEDRSGGKVRLAGGELGTGSLELGLGTNLGQDWSLSVEAGRRGGEGFAVSRVGMAEYSVPCDPASGLVTDCLPQEEAPIDPDEEIEALFSVVRLDKRLQSEAGLTFEVGTTDLSSLLVRTDLGRALIDEATRSFSRIAYHGKRASLQAIYDVRDSRQQSLETGADQALDSQVFEVEGRTDWSCFRGKGRIELGGWFGLDRIDSFDASPRPVIGVVGDLLPMLPLGGAGGIPVATGPMQTLLHEQIDAERGGITARIEADLSSRLSLAFEGVWQDASTYESEFAGGLELGFELAPRHRLRLNHEEWLRAPTYAELSLQAEVAPVVDLSLLVDDDGDPIDLLCETLWTSSCGLGPTPVAALGNENLTLERFEISSVHYSGGFPKRQAALSLALHFGTHENLIVGPVSPIDPDGNPVNPDFGPWRGTPLTEFLEYDATSSVGDVIRATVPSLTNNLDGSDLIAAATYTNAGRARVGGIEINYLQRFGDRWHWQSRLGWFDFDVSGLPAEWMSQALPNTPEARVSQRLAFEGERVNAMLDVRWVDDFLWSDGLAQGEVESYTTVDAAARIMLSPRWAVGVNVVNLLDDEHWEVFGGDLLVRRGLAYLEHTW